MTCNACQSEKQRFFNSEIAIHLPGLDGLDKPLVFVFPKLVVCLDCARTEFTVTERELQVLRQGSPVEGAVVSCRKSDVIPDPQKTGCSSQRAPNLLTTKLFAQ